MVTNTKDLFLFLSLIDCFFYQLFFALQICCTTTITTRQRYKMSLFYYTYFNKSSKNLHYF